MGIVQLFVGQFNIYFYLPPGYFNYYADKYKQSKQVTSKIKETCCFNKRNLNYTLIRFLVLCLL